MLNIPSIDQMNMTGDVFASATRVIHEVMATGKSRSVPAKIQEWFDQLGPGWEFLSEDEVAILLLPLEDYADDDLVDQEIVENDDLSLVDDAARLTFARMMHEQLMRDDDNVVFAYTVPLWTTAGDVAYLCCRVETHGQGGPHAIWDAIHRSQATYYQWLIERGLWPMSVTLEPLESIGLPSDEEILSRWRR